jgi:hypothetical protein
VTWDARPASRKVQHSRPGWPRRLVPQFPAAHVTGCQLPKGALSCRSGHGGAGGASPRNRPPLPATWLVSPARADEVGSACLMTSHRRASATALRPGPLTRLYPATACACPPRVSDGSSACLSYAQLPWPHGRSAWVRVPALEHPGFSRPSRAHTLTRPGAAAGQLGGPAMIVSAFGKQAQGTCPASTAPAACRHVPRCPPATAPCRAAARTVAAHPEQGWSLLCNGVILFDDTGQLLPGGQALPPRRPRCGPWS